MLSKKKKEREENCSTGSARRVSGLEDIGSWKTEMQSCSHNKKVSKNCFQVIPQQYGLFSQGVLDSLARFNLTTTQSPQATTPASSPDPSPVTTATTQ